MTDDGRIHRLLLNHLGAAADRDRLLLAGNTSSRRRREAAPLETLDHPFSPPHSSPSNAGIHGPRLLAEAASPLVRGRPAHTVEGRPVLPACRFDVWSRLRDGGNGDLHAGDACRKLRALAGGRVDGKPLQPLATPSSSAAMQRSGVGFAAGHPLNRHRAGQGFQP